MSEHVKVIYVAWCVVVICIEKHVLTVCGAQS